MFQSLTLLINISFGGCYTGFFVADVWLICDVAFVFSWCLFIIILIMIIIASNCYKLYDFVFISFFFVEAVKIVLYQKDFVMKWTHCGFALMIRGLKIRKKIEEHLEMKWDDVGV